MFRFLQSVVHTNKKKTFCSFGSNQIDKRGGFTTPLKVVKHLYTFAQSYSKGTSSYCKVTTLPNGIRVTSEDTPGYFGAAGVYIDCGSRYETNKTRGVSYFLDRLAFKSTINRTTEEVMAELQYLGGHMICSSSREFIMYQSAIFSQDLLDRAFSLFFDVIYNSIISTEEVREQHYTTPFELDEIWSKPEMILPEVLHTSAYGENTLGNPLLCSSKQLKTITPELIHNYRNTWYTPDRTVIAVCGTGHDRVVELALQHFGKVPKPAENLDSVMTHLKTLERQTKENQKVDQKHSIVGSILKSALTSSKTKMDPFQLATQPAQYIGGNCYLEVNSTKKNLNHVYISFEGLSIDDPDIYALITLQILLGGGGSFSTAGPGKGMYSRLFTQILNQYHWIESCQAFNYCYTDSGLFGIAGSCLPEHTNRLIEIICQELDCIAGMETDCFAPSDIELNRAKNQLKSALLMNLEIRMIQLEDLGRQVQIHGKKKCIDEVLMHIDNVNMLDLKRVASRIIRGAISESSGGSGRVTTVVYGDLKNLADINKVIDMYGLGSKK